MDPRPPLGQSHQMRIIVGFELPFFFFFFTTRLHNKERGGGAEQNSLIDETIKKEEERDSRMERRVIFLDRSQKMKRVSASALG